MRRIVQSRELPNLFGKNDLRREGRLSLRTEYAENEDDMESERSPILEVLARAIANLFSMGLVSVGAFLLYAELITPSVLSSKETKPKRNPAVKTENLEPLKAIWPVQGKRVQVGPNGIHFRWISSRSMEPHLEAGKHWVEVFAEGTKEPAFKQTVGAECGQVNWKEIKQGKWVWRVVSQYSSSRISSQLQRFEVESHRQAKLVLDYPPEDAALKFRPGIKFGWSIDAEATSYSFQLWSADGKVVQEQKTSVPVVLWEKPAPGEYQWRVVALDSLKRAVGESPWRNLALLQDPIELMSPASISMLSYDGKSEMKFSWRGEAIAEASPNFFRVEIAKDSDFKTLVSSEKLKTTRFVRDEFGLDAGRYYWRVAMVGPNDAIVRKSGTRPLDLSLPSRLPAPKPVAPASETVIAGKAARSIDLNWENVNGAKSFQIVLKSEGQDVFKTTSARPETRLSRLKPGVYQWEVAAVDRWNRSGEPSIRKFIIR